MTGQPGFDQNSPTVQFTLSRQPGPGGAQTLTAVHRSSGKPLSVHEIHFPPAATPDERRAQAGQVRWEVDRLALLHENPNVLTVYGVVEEQNRLWIVTEPLIGTNLARAVAATGPLPVPEAARVASAVLGALAAAHSAGVAHRGVRPAAIVRCEDGRVVLTGFCATPVKSFPEPAALEFADPHRVRTGQATFGGDVFSFGSTLYYLLEGAAPFARPTPQAAVAAIQGAQPPAPRRAGPLTTVLMALLTRNQNAVLTPAVAREQVDAVLAAGARAGAGGPGVSASNAGVGAGVGAAKSPPNPVASPTPALPAARTNIPVPPSMPGTAPNASPSALPNAGLPAAAQPPWTPSRILWLLTALAAAVTTLIAVYVSWGTVTYAGQSAAQTSSGSLFDMLKTGASTSTAPKPAILGWAAPVLLPLLGTAFFGLTAALVSRRWGRLCAGFALLGLTAEVGGYLWVADIPAGSDYAKPTVALHAGGYLGLAGAGAALLLGLAGLIRDQAQAAADRTAAAPQRQVGLVIRIAAGLCALVAAVAVFLPFAESGHTRLSALEWSQLSVLTEGCCLIAVMLFALVFRAPRRPLTASGLAIPAAIAFVLQVMPMLQVIGLNGQSAAQYGISFAYGCWIGLGATLVGFAVSALGYRGARAAAAPFGYPPDPARGGGYGLPAAQRSYPQQLQQPQPAQQPHPQPGQAPGGSQG